MLFPGYSMGSLKNVSLFGSDVWPPIANIYKNKYIYTRLIGRYIYLCMYKFILKKKKKIIFFKTKICFYQTKS